MRTQQLIFLSLSAFLFLFFLFPTTLSLSLPSPITLTVQNFTFPTSERIGWQKAWRQSITGGDASRRRSGPHSFSSVSCKSKLFVAWTAMTGTVPSRYPGYVEDVSTVFVHEFDVVPSSSSPTLTLVREVRLPWCQENGGITATSDCSVIGLLCRANSTSFPPGKVVDMEAVALSTYGKYPFGFNQTSGKDRIIDNMLLMEYTHGQVTASPSKTYKVVHAIGGWAFGHWEVAVNKNGSLFAVLVKTTIGSDASGWHEGAISYKIKRSSDTFLEYPSWGCGPGHVIGNRLTYNQELDTFASLCWLDFNSDKIGGTWSAHFSGSLGGKSAQILAFNTTDLEWGGPAGLVSIGQEGYLASAVGPMTGIRKPSPRAWFQNNTIGVGKLPASTTAADAYPKATAGNNKFKWFKVPNVATEKIGLPNLQRIGSSDSYDRFLIGWAEMAYGSAAKDYYVMEINSNGDPMGPITRVSETGGWGDDTLWTYLPASGCVAMPFTWTTQSTDKYTDWQMGPAPLNFFTKSLKITLVCPSSSSPQPQPTSPHPTTARPTSPLPTNAQPTTPKPTTPRPTTPPPQPTTSRPTTARPNPTTARPNPTTARPNPTTARPNPTTARPNPTTARPNPTTARPNPTTAPNPTSARPNPTTPLCKEGQVTFNDKDCLKCPLAIRIWREEQDPTKKPAMWKRLNTSCKKKCEAGFGSFDFKCYRCRYLTRMWKKTPDTETMILKGLVNALVNECVYARTMF